MTNVSYAILSVVGGSSVRIAQFDGSTSNVITWHHALELTLFFMQIKSYIGDIWGCLVGLQQNKVPSIVALNFGLVDCRRVPQLYAFVVTAANLCRSSATYKHASIVMIAKFRLDSVLTHWSNSACQGVFSGCT